MKRIGISAFTLVCLAVLFNNCEGPDGKWQGPENGTGYSGLRPEAGVYSARVVCANGEGFENLTVRDDSDTALIQNECTNQSSEVQVTALSYQPYRKEHLGLKDQIYEKNMPREPEYYNEAMCDFADRKFGILIRFYEQNVYHVAHIFTLSGMNAIPVVRFSDVSLADGHYGTGYIQDNFQLAIVNSYPIGEGFFGVFSGKVNGEDILETFGYCITTVYSCSPIHLNVSGTGTSGQFTVASVGGGTTSVTGTMKLSTEIPDIYALDLDVNIEGTIYDCAGYVHTASNELTVGGCKDRPTDGSDPKRVMVQVRGVIQWSDSNNGNVTSKVCKGDLLRDP